jgi:hypothetical protein
MSNWTLVARGEEGSISVDLTIDGGSALPLGSVEAETLEVGLEKALAVVDNASGRISCVNAGAQIVVAIDKITVASLRYDRAELMRSQLQDLLAGNGTEFAG